MASKSKTPKGTADAEEGARKYLSQTDVPAYSLEHALRIPTAIADNFGKQPTRPLRVAQALEVAPGSSTFRMLCGASIAYGLTEGGYNSDQIALTALARRVVAPTQEGDDLAARREAILRPRILRDFLSRYNGSKLPPENIAVNVLEELSVPSDRARDVYQLIVESAKGVGFLQEVKGVNYIDLESTAIPAVGDTDQVNAVGTRGDTTKDTKPLLLPPPPATPAPAADLTTPAPLKKTGRVFITHGKNHEIVAQLKELLTFGSFTPVVAIDNESVSKPVPDKVMDDMRSCQAALIHVGAETRLLDDGGKEHRMLNQNVLIEIGAAMALYGRKFILLVEKGATLPSNLQGLYEVRYEGGKLDYEATMKLLKAFNDFRS